MNETLQVFVEVLQERWLHVAFAALLTVLTTSWGIFWGWHTWRTRKDMGVLHISQNTVEERPTGAKGAMEKWLILDVHSENRLRDDIDHPIPRWLIRRAAKKTTFTNPLVRFPEKDRWYILNTVRLLIAERFILGTAAKMAKQAKVEVVECVFALTYERYPNMRQGKIRVMVIEKGYLETPDFFQQDFRLESESHADRAITLALMQQDYLRENPEACMSVRLNIQL